ncbi:phosphotransferase [Streptomyces sp. AC550_RSS872]|uniref:phosphotransferase n=1 Tax=Streptomyces sp. AC550_RSS872 TaxID=2823689 RepID=UPI001C257493|nr:phosphotransferase [Streptomyces sp. AC550_RSS872]
MECGRREALFGARWERGRTRCLPAPETRSDPAPAGWSEDVDGQGLRNFARLLRDCHDASSGFSAPPGATWSTDTAVPGDDEVVCHGDFGPWNVVWQGSPPVGIIAWDFARPATRLHDVAYAPECVAPFRDDAERRRRLHCIAGQRAPADLVRRPAEQGPEPQATRGADGLLIELDDGIGWSAAHPHLAESPSHPSPPALPGWPFPRLGDHVPDSP